MTIVQKYRSYLRYEKNYSLHTEISYSKDLAQFQAYLSLHCEDVSLEDVESDIVRRWVASLIEQNISPRTVSRKLSSLKSFYRFLRKIEVIDFNPLQRVVAPKINKSLPSFVNHTDMGKILDDMGDSKEMEDFDFCRDYVVLELFYLTGMRRAELIGLKDSDVDLSVNLIRVTGKRNKQRMIPFSSKTKAVLELYLAKRGSEFEQKPEAFFVRKNGKSLYPMMVYRLVHERLKWVATLKKASPHVLRHSFATGMLNNGSEINAVKELLGHTSLSSTEVYTHTSFEELKKAYKNAHPREDEKDK